MTSGLTVVDSGREPSLARLPAPPARAGAATPETGPRAAGGTVLPPAVSLTLSAATRTASERLLVYGRPGSAGTEKADATEADPARMLDRKVAEARKEVAALEIRRTKVAARDAGVLALLNPAGGVSFAKNAAKSLSNAMRTFGEAEKTIARVEDETLAETAAEEVTAIAYDVYERASTLDMTVAGRKALDAALARRLEDAPRAAEASDFSIEARGATSTRIEVLSVVRIRDEAPIADRMDAIEAARPRRMEQDAEVIKDGVSALRHLDRLIAVSTRRMQETGSLDARNAREIAEARDAWHDAAADTALAALPVVKAGYSIVPDADE